jgi:hypothetical protein
MTTLAKKTTSKYTPEMETAIRDAAPLDLEICEQLATEPMFVKAGVTARGIAAKARSLQVEYNKQERVTKAGEPIATKEALVTEIENAMQVSGLKSLAKAEKKALQVLLRAVKFETERVA